MSRSISSRLLRCIPLFAMLTFVLPVQAARILVMGDSLSAAHGIAREAGWVTLLQRRLTEEGYGHEVINASIGGDTTRGGVARLPRALEVHDPDIVIIELGGNDGLRGIPVDVSRENLARMVRMARDHGARVLLVGIQLPPNYGQVYTEEFRNVYHELARSEGVRLVPFLLEGVAMDPSLMQEDGIHPNAAAQTKMMETVWARLVPMLCDPDADV